LIDELWSFQPEPSLLLLPPPTLRLQPTLAQPPGLGRLPASVGADWVELGGEDNPNARGSGGRGVRANQEGLDRRRRRNADEALRQLSLQIRRYRRLNAGQERQDVLQQVQETHQSIQGLLE
jgi:hypothetical protein